MAIEFGTNATSNSKNITGSSEHCQAWHGIICAKNSLAMANDRKTVLIVEDNLDWRQLLTMVIRRLGYDVIAAGTGTAGVEQAVALQPDLILMDLGLPEMTGDEATIRIKTNPATRHIPIIVQTAFGTSPGAKRAMDAGAAQLMHKPISISDIQNMVRRYLSAGSETEAGRQNPSLSNQPAVPEGKESNRP